MQLSEQRTWADSLPLRYPCVPRHSAANDVDELEDPAEAHGWASLSRARKAHSAPGLGRGAMASH